MTIAQGLVERVCGPFVARVASYDLHCSSGGRWSVICGRGKHVEIMVTDLVLVQAAAWIVNVAAAVATARCPIWNRVPDALALVMAHWLRGGDDLEVPTAASIEITSGTTLGWNGERWMLTTPEGVVLRANILHVCLALPTLLADPLGKRIGIEESRLVLMLECRAAVPYPKPGSRRGRAPGIGSPAPAHVKVPSVSGSQRLHNRLCRDFTKAWLPGAAPRLRAMNTPRRSRGPIAMR